jgi:hypothetical protein
LIVKRQPQTNQLNEPFAERPARHDRFIHVRGDGGVLGTMRENSREIDLKRRCPGACRTLRKARRFSVSIDYRFYACHLRNSYVNEHFADGTTFSHPSLYSDSKSDFVKPKKQTASRN